MLFRMPATWKQGAHIVHRDTAASDSAHEVVDGRCARRKREALLDQFKEAVITIEQHSCFEFAPMPMTPMHQGNDGSAPCAYSLSALVA